MIKRHPTKRGGIPIRDIQARVETAKHTWEEEELDILRRAVEVPLYARHYHREWKASSPNTLPGNSVRETWDINELIVTFDGVHKITDMAGTPLERRWIEFGQRVFIYQLIGRKWVCKILE